MSERDIEHGHCPDGCDHPQPFTCALTRAESEFYYLDPSLAYEFCGRCWHVLNEITALVPCGPPYCEEAHK